MKYLYLILLAFFAYTGQSTAQRNFKPGYIVSLKGDTTKGFIDYKDWLENPKLIDFKPSESAASKQHYASGIKAFGVTSIDHYVSYTGPISTGAVQLADLSSGINNKKIIDTVFLRAVIIGSKVSLYSYTDKIKTRFFITEANATPAELERYVYRDNSNNTNILERNVYQEQLKILADKYQAGNTTLSNRIQRATYELREMERIITAINGANETSKVAIAKREEVLFFIGAAANFNQVSFSGDNVDLKDDMFSAGVKSTSVGPSFNVGLDYFFNKNSGKLIFRTELSVSLNKITGYYEHLFVDYNRTFTVKESLNANQLNVSFNPQFIYNVVNKSQLKFYIGAGMQFNKAFNSDTYYYLDFYENNALNNRNERPIAYRGLFINPTIKLGILLPNIAEFYAGYNAPSEIFNDRTINARLSAFRFGVNYHFGKK